MSNEIRVTLRDLSEMKRSWSWIEKDIAEGKIIVIADDRTRTEGETGSKNSFTDDSRTDKEVKGES